MDDPGSLVQTGVDLVTKAVQEDKKGNYEEALGLYDRGMESFQMVVDRGDLGENQKDTILAKGNKYQLRAERLRTYLASSGDPVSKAIALVTRACEEDRKGHYEEEKGQYEGAKGRYEEAVGLYEKGLDTFQVAMNSSTVAQKHKETIGIKCIKYRERCEKLKAYLLKKKVGGEVSGTGLPKLFRMDKPRTDWDGIVGLDGAKEALKAYVTTGVLLNTAKGILMFGPPGCGKTSLAIAVAGETAGGTSGTTFLSLPTSHLISKRLEEWRKLEIVKNIFAVARENKPSVIFIDDMDSLYSIRSIGHLPDSIRSVRTELLVQMQGVGFDNDGVCVLGATSVPWVLEPSVRKLFEKKIHVPLPAVDARRKLFQLQLGDKTPEAKSNHSTAVDLQHLADKSAGYSGADIGCVVADALMTSVRQVQDATHFRRVSAAGPSRTNVGQIGDDDVDLLTPCSPDAPGAIAMSWEDIVPPGKKLLEPDVNLSGLLECLGPRVGEEYLLKLNQFVEDHGQ